MTRKTSWIVGEALALVVITGSSTVATGARADGAASPVRPSRRRVQPRSSIWATAPSIETEAGENGTPSKSRSASRTAATVEVDLDANFKVIGEPAGEESADDEEGASDRTSPATRKKTREARSKDDWRRSPSRSCESSESRPRASGSTSPCRHSRTLPSSPTRCSPSRARNRSCSLGQVDDRAVPHRGHPAPRHAGSSSGQGQMVETLVSQYVAYLGGRIHEVAYDLYAQADDGSVWYFGEDVFNFADGVDRRHPRHLACRQGWPGGDDHARRAQGRRRLPAGEYPRPRLRGGHGQGGRPDAGRPARPVEGGLLGRGAPPGRQSREKKTFAPAMASSSPAAAATSKLSPSPCPPTRSPGRRRRSSSMLKTGAGDSLRRRPVEGLERRPRATLEEMTRRLGELQGRRDSGDDRDRG